MKPTVIASGGSENPSSHHPADNSVNPAANMGPNGEGGSGAPNTSPNSRQFPQFQTGFGFDPDDDIFSDAGLRSRLNRFRDPFSFARKRCGNNDNPDDPYSRYFDDDSDFFPNFRSFPERRRVPSQTASTANTSPFFDIPAEFRHYIPDSFGFPNARTTSAATPQYQQQAHPQQYHEAYVQPPSPPAQPPQQKPKLCDAAIQTEDLTEPDGAKEGKNLHQYGMRNTVDLGQKSPLEECRGPRSHSAPPPHNGAQNAPERQCAPDATQTNVSNNQNLVEDSHHKSQGTQPMTPITQHGQQPQYQTWQQHQQQHQPQQQQHQPHQQQHQPHQQQQQPQHQQQQPQYQQQQQPHATSSGSGYTRTVPIFVEGRSDPLINKNVIPPQQQSPHQAQTQQHAEKRKPGHPTPINLNTQQPTPPNSQIPPQTPQTAECICKIQAIQRDVLDLMTKVEHFQGMRGDKEYMYLDEMLTRNLLKLDTIDTNGKDSIRLARREAIKCIQASINVLEAKSEENAKAAQTPPQQAVIEDSGEESKIVEEVKAGQAALATESTEDEAASLPPENVAIPLPPPPSKESETEPSDHAKVEESTAGEVKSVQAKEEEQHNVDQKSVERTDKEEIPAEAEPQPALQIDSEAKAQTTSNVQLATQKKNESGNESDSPKPVSTGAIKKKIVKKKKAPTKCTSPPENLAPENPPTQKTAQVERTEQKSEKDTNQPE